MIQGKVKVYHLTTSFWTSHGPSNNIMAQIRGHGGQDFDFSIWSLYGPPPDQDPREMLHKAGLGYQVFPMGPSFLDVRVLGPLVRQLRRDPPDVLHCHLLRANLYGRIAARLAGVDAVINTIHGMDESITGSGLLSNSLRLVQRLTAGWVSRYVAVSENVRKAVIKHLKIDPGKISTILNALDLSPFQRLGVAGNPVREELGLAPEAVSVGSVGRLSPLKNYAALVEWTAQLMAIFPQVQLAVIGDGEERQSLDNLISGLNLQDRVRLPGFRTDIPRVLGAMDIFALPSISEGLSIALLEAMAAGLPCVVMDVGGNAEAVVDGQTGFVVPLGDGPGFQAALTLLINDVDLRKKMGTAGKKRAFKLFNPKRLAAEYAALYRSVLNRNQGL